MPVASTQIGPFVVGPNTLWPGLHGLLMFIILVFSAFLFGAIFFTRTPDPRTVRRLKISAAVTFAALLLLMISGIIPDIGFGNVTSFAGTTSNAYGTFHSSVTATGLGNFTGPLLFDMMEHVSLVVPGLAAVAGVLIFTAGDRVITVPAIRTSVLWLMSITGIWSLIIGAIGAMVTSTTASPT
jgi:hypothetical protein